MKRVFTLIFSLIAIMVSAQIVEPISWTSSIEMNDDNTGSVTVSANIESGWHVYGLESVEDGPIPTQISVILPEGISAVGDLTPSVAAEKGFDSSFGCEISYWDKDITFTQVIERTSDVSAPVVVKIRYQACDDKRCLPPSSEEFKLSISGQEVEAAATDARNKAGNIISMVASNSDKEMNSLWKPVTMTENTESIASSPWWKLFIWGFGGGLIALLTPCVWPLIPMTVSFFLKKGKTRRESIRDAMIYGSSIVVIYLVLGLAITMIFGASKLNELSTNAIFNLIFFLLLVVFAISFFGAFDIKLPSKWSNTVDNKAERATGLISIFFMAFTLALVSFSCTGPIIGTLLVEAASSGDIAGPAIGMTGFAIALALPFTLFAIFPSWLKEMPKSGGWLNSVKVVLGFIELALSLKFLSVADLAYGWGLVDREVFLALWIVIFLLLGMYLLGKIRFSHDEPVEHLSVTRFFLSIVSLSFMVYLIPGLWGAPLKGVSAFVPPLYTQDFSLYAGGDFEEFDDYETGMKYAAENNRPVLVDFSGYGCVNCRKMEGAVFDTEVVKDIIEKDYVLIKLMVDDKHDLTEPMVVTENGKEKTLYTVGDKWSYLQRYKFGANTQPYYVILDGKTGDAMTTSRSYNENITEFVEWLDEGINNYKKAE
ncbi:MAG: thiol:disulfide interchange protein [Bacteroidales bacterium]|nr:thiol:disulfide interchange protein [Bacteroidales bacterium]